jgi:nucleotide-binding universal stress UspA family protein
MNAIVVGTDGSPGAEAAIQKVIELAQGTDATVHLVSAYPTSSALARIGMSAKQEPIDLRGVAYDVVARDEHRFEEAGLAVEKHVREGEAAHTILEVAAEQNADLIAVGARGNAGQRRFMLGGVPGKLAHHAQTSLLIVRDD